MMTDQTSLAGLNHPLMSAFGHAQRTSQAATTPSAASHLATLQAHFQNMTSQAGKVSPQLNERHTPQSDEHSAGSGSVGAGPRLGQINGTIDVKLEEVRENEKKSRVFNVTERITLLNTMLNKLEPRCQHHLTLSTVLLSVS